MIRIFLAFLLLLPCAAWAQCSSSNPTACGSSVLNTLTLGSQLNLGKWATSGRPSTPIVGAYGYNTTTGQTELWTGTAWANISTSSVNLPTIAPLTTTIGTGVTTLWNAASFYSVRITLPSNVQVSCTGDGSTPVLGTSYLTANYGGQTISWPDQPGGTMPTGAIKCIAATSTSFAPSGNNTYLEAH